MGEKVDYIIVGQGIAGTLLSYLLLQKGNLVKVVDQGHRYASSKVAAGTINPITGRKYVKSWRIEDFLPVAKSLYTEIGDFLQIKAFSEKNILRVLFTPEDENTWLARSADPLAAQYIIDPADFQECEGKLLAAPAFGELTQSLQVHLIDIIEAMRVYLLRMDCLLEEQFDYKLIEHEKHQVTYRNIEAKAILFAEGHAVTQNPYFKQLPWQTVKGEVLLVRIPGAPFKKVVRHRIFITHMKDDIYWVGSAYIHNFTDAHPTKEEGQRLREELTSILNLPYEVVDHIAGIRPAVSGRRPLIGRHPKYKNLILFNGLGTKGASLGPYFAKHLVDHILNEIPLEPQVDRILNY